MTVLELTDLAIGYAPKCRRARVVAQGINLRLRAGSLTCLLGPNGAGKSTLLRTLGGLQRPLNGAVTLDGCPLERLAPQALARRLSLVLTDPVAVGTLPVWSLVAMGRYPHTDWTGRLRPEDEAAVNHAIAAMRIESLAFRPMCALSDGERQKVMIARALAQEPSIMILDEAMAYLDLPRRVELMLLLRELARERECAILMSCHDLDLSLRHADRLWLLSINGKVCEGIPEDLVLMGELGATFSDSVLYFDLWSGAFAPARGAKGRVSVQGNDLAATWARRALERSGYEIVTERADWHVTLTGNAGQVPHWRLHGSRESAGKSLESLLEALGWAAHASSACE